MFVLYQLYLPYILGRLFYLQTFKQKIVNETAGGPKDPARLNFEAILFQYYLLKSVENIFFPCFVVFLTKWPRAR